MPRQRALQGGTQAAPDSGTSPHSGAAPDTGTDAYRLGASNSATSSINVKATRESMDLSKNKNTSGKGHETTFIHHSCFIIVAACQIIL